MKIRASLFSRNFTLSHVRVVAGSKEFSEVGTNSPILHAVKKHSVQAVQKICFEKSDQLSSVSLWLKISNKWMFIGSLSGFAESIRHDTLLAPLRTIFTQGSELRLLFGVFACVWATLRLDMYDFMVLLLRPFFVTAHVAKALAYSGEIGTVKLTVKLLQKFS